MGVRAARCGGKGAGYGTGEAGGKDRGCMQERQNKAMRSELSKKEMEIRRAMREEEKRRVQIEKMQRKQEKSKDRHRRILTRVEHTGEKRGGEFEVQWQRGEGKWVRTDKPRRRDAWIDDMNKTIYVVVQTMVIHLNSAYI